MVPFTVKALHGEVDLSHLPVAHFLSGGIPSMPGYVPASIPMITKGSLEAGLRSLASEYAKEHIRFNAVAPGVVDTPLHAEDPKNSLKTLSPMGSISTVEDIASAVVYLTEAGHITGEVLHVDGGAHFGKW